MIEEIARRYPGRWLQGYVRGKLRSDPAYAAIAEALRGSELPVLDVGCGVGLLGQWLREQGYAGKITGFDFDARKIETAQHAAAGNPGLAFHLAAIAEPLPSLPGHVVILDVLHYLAADAQRDLLKRAAAHVAPGGRCVIRECPRDGSWRFRMTQLEERFIHAIAWMKTGACHFPSVEEIVAPFGACGFDCEVRPLWGRTPFNSHLFTLRAPV